MMISVTHISLGRGKRFLDEDGRGEDKGLLPCRKVYILSHAEVQDCKAIGGAWG